MDCSIFSAPKLWLFHVFLLFIFYLLCLNKVSGTATDVDYGRHCNSVVHESIPDADEEFNIMPFPGRQNGYFSGGDKVLNNPSHMYHSLVFETHHVYATKVVDVFKVEGNLIFQTSYSYEQSFSRDSLFVTSSGDSSDRGTLDLDFQGFWSRTTGELCMVGPCYTYSEEGKLLHLAAVLKINNLKSSSNITTLITGTIDILNFANDTNYFDQISLLMFPQVNYAYTPWFQSNLVKGVLWELMSKSNRCCPSACRKLELFAICFLVEPMFTNWSMQVSVILPRVAVHLEMASDICLQ
ncbi:hypothetical protein V6N13_142441 [Hibiscus sabdariffa]